MVEDVSGEGSDSERVSAEEKDAKEGNPEFLYAYKVDHAYAVVTLPGKTKGIPELLDTYKCKKCPDSWTTYPEYQEHQKYHGSGSRNKLKCPLCDFACRVKETFNSHIDAHNQNAERQRDRESTGKRRVPEDEESSDDGEMWKRARIRRHESDSDLDIEDMEEDDEDSDWSRESRSPGSLSDSSSAFSRGGSPPHEDQEPPADSDDVVLEQASSAPTEALCVYSASNDSPATSTSEPGPSRAKSTFTPTTTEEVSTVVVEVGPAANSDTGTGNENICQGSESISKAGPSRTITIPNFAALTILQGITMGLDSITTAGRDDDLGGSGVYALLLKLLRSPAEEGKGLVTNIQVTNFMEFETFELPLEPSGGFVEVNDSIVGVIGKSALLIALLLGLGYDVLDENYVPASICGRSLQGLIRKGSTDANIELTISLHSSEALRKLYGSHMKIFRVVNSDSASATFNLYSADPSRETRNSTLPSIQEFRRTLEDIIGIVPKVHRLLLLDGVNVNYFLQNPAQMYCAMYTFYGLILEQRQGSIKSNEEKLKFSSERLELLKFEIDKLDMELNLRRKLEGSGCPKGFESLELEEAKLISRLSAQRGARQKEYEELEPEIRSLKEAIQRSQLPLPFLDQMNDVFKDYLSSQYCEGGILIDEERKELGAWVWKLGPQDQVAPSTLERAKGEWNCMRVGEKTSGVIGLYLALWSISSRFPLFVVDGFSLTEHEFCIPRTGRAVFKEVLGKAGKGSPQVFFTSDSPKES